MIEGMEQVNRLLQGLEIYFSSGAKADITKASIDIAEQAREAIRDGQNTNGSPMAPLRKATLEGPIRMEGDNTPRSQYGATPLSASGKTANSIVSKKSGTNEWEISSNSDKGDMILSSNAKQGHSGSPFGGDTPKVVRDPLQVSDKHMDIIENKLVDGIDRALNG